VKKSITRNITFALLAYTLFTVVLLWMFQIIFLNKYYQMMQKASIIRAGKQLAQQIDQPNFEDILESTCFSHRMSAFVFDTQNTMRLSVDMLGRGSLFNLRDKGPDIVKLLSPVISGEENELVKIVSDEHFRNFALIYAISVDSAGGRRVILLNTWLEPVWSMSSILKSQLGIITTVLIASALGISVYVARRLTRPIENITIKAQKLAKGDYTADFEGDGIEELERLASTLNFSAKGLSRVEELRRELVANVSHDLKTPLTMIKAYAEMIQDLTGNNAARRNEQLEVIISEADRLSALVNDLIRVSKDEATVRDYHAANFSIEKLLEDIIRRFSQLYSDYEIELDCPGTCMVFADHDAIAQVLYNLISNAINYTGEDKKVYISAAQTVQNIRVEISDTGNGIPPEELNLIWERYYRSRNNHKRPVAGSGLGLPIVRGILEGQKLPYGVHSTVGKGSCFWFELPVGEENAATGSDAEDEI
jgi:signal transduction histidine kinase